MRTYIAEIKSRKGGNAARLIVDAENRGTAVHKAELWFWKKFKGSLGRAVDALTVNDPYGEVKYGPKFHCGSRTNRYLPPDIIERVLGEAKGELIRDERESLWHHPRGAVRRRKRRRDFGKFLLPNIKVMRNGALYYRVVAVPQCTRNGRRFRKRKQKDIRLIARNPREALAEIEARGLQVKHAAVTKRNVTSRSLALLEDEIQKLELENLALA